MCVYFSACLSVCVWKKEREREREREREIESEMEGAIYSMQV